MPITDTNRYLAFDENNGDYDYVHLDFLDILHRVGEQGIGTDCKSGEGKGTKFHSCDAIVILFL
jgi:hypothetical protein